MTSNQKIIYSTTDNAAGTGMFVDQNDNETIFVCVNKIAGSNSYGYWVNGEKKPSVYVDASEAWLQLCEYLSVEKLLPIGRSQVAKMFGEEYTSKDKVFKENLASLKKKTAERNKRKEAAHSEETFVWKQGFRRN
ncbi:hypothetical protein NVP1084O_218 [Vibrio phage 1.084.O._10N.261.49.F5]|nr:hypothetical protein NVP1084O_218 [Vibrio phage 1.084.O._10N.261.49.F5]